MLKKIFFIMSVIMVLLVASIYDLYALNPTIQVWVSQVNEQNTGMEKGLEQVLPLEFVSEENISVSNLIIVDESQHYQKMDGFGASITEASAHLYQNVLNENYRLEVMNSLFDKETGIGISMLRQPIGATDHCVAPYNFAPVIQDETLPYYDFSHELQTILPTVQEALNIEPERIKIIASSWSAPGWMKENQSELGMYNGIKGKLRRDKYQTYANYLLKFIQKYNENGIDIYAVTPTNEPDHASYDWPAMPMTHEEAQILVSNYLYPTIRNANLNTKIISWDHSYTTTNYPRGLYPFRYFSMPEAFSSTDGTAWHWYEGDEEVMSVVHKEYPTKDIWFTEGSGGEWGFPKWKTAFLNQASSIINIARNWSKSIIFWNMALDENGGPDYYYDINQQQNSTNRGLITIKTDGTWERNVDYYTLGHISKFVEPEAYRIDSTSLNDNIETVAFKNPDGSKVLILANLIEMDQNITILWGNKSANYTIPGESLVTMVWNGIQSEKAKSPIWYNNFENITGFSADNSSSIVVSPSTANLGTSNGIKLTTTVNGDPLNDKQCAIISPQLGEVINASEYQYLTFSVKDMVNPEGCTIKVTFVDQSGNISSSWSHEKTVFKNWTRIWVPIGGSYGFDRRNISQIRLGFYWRGDYFIDDLSFSYAYSDGIPSFNDGNLINNGSFEDDGCVIVNPKGWHFDGATPEATYLEKNSNSASGRFHVVHYSPTPFDAYTWQVLYGLENGTYTLRAMVQSGGGQVQNKILATDFGGQLEKNITIPVSTPWCEVEITDIQVTNRQCTIGFYTEGKAGDWSCADNFILIKTN